MTDSLFDAVDAAIRDAATRAVMPRWRALEAGAITEKSPSDWVTDADHQCEELLTAAIGDIEPGVPVIGEEASASDPSQLRDAYQHDRSWVLDPVDGTKSFIDGSPDFATMVALTDDNLVTAAWIWQPAHGRMFTASRGSGAFADGARLSPPASPGGSAPSLRGVLRTRYMPEELRAAALAGLVVADLGAVDVTASGVVYPMTAIGALTHALYWRTLPWDHAPGTLIAQEAGLCVARLDGSEYRPWDARFGVLTATDQETWNTVRAVLPSELDDSSTP